MTENIEEFNYGDIIAYIDSTRDLYFEAARKWAYTHNATFNELIDRRENRNGILYRYWEIKQKPQPTEEELINEIRVNRISELHSLLDNSDYVIIKIAEAQALGNSTTVTELLEEYANIIENRQEWRRELNELLSEDLNTDESGE